MPLLFHRWIAVQNWGEPRLTRDIDISLLAGFGAEEPIMDLVLGSFAARIEDARGFALDQRVLLVRSAGGIGIDISLAALPYEQLVIEKAQLIELLPGRSLRLCSPEDLVIMKLFAGRDIDIRDARSVVVRQGDDRLNWNYIETHLAEFAEIKGDPGLIAQLKRIRSRIR